MRVLVTSGTGYIGGAAVERLRAAGHSVVVSDGAAVRQVFRESPIDAVIHLAGSAVSGGSHRDPRICYFEIVGQTIELLDAMLDSGIGRIVFLSSASVYGTPEKVPVREEAQPAPINSHGEAMLAVERMLQWYDESYGLRYVALRCFNAAGAATVTGRSPENDLITNVLKAAAGETDCVQIFGEDYPTPDGTCIRDYVHVIDVAEAATLALNATERGSETYNVGYGSGYSVAEVVEMARQVTGRWISTEAAPRRRGDAPALIASADRIMRDLGWNPRHSELDRIIESAWRGKLNRNII